MIGAGRREIERPYAVGQDPDAVARKAAQDRGRRAWAEAGRRDARKARERLAEIRAKLAVERAFIEHGHPGEHVLGAPLDAGYDDGVVAVMMRLGCGTWNRLGGAKPTGKPAAAAKPAEAEAEKAPAKKAAAPKAEAAEASEAKAPAKKAETKAAPKKPAADTEVAAEKPAKKAPAKKAEPKADKE